jgi:hypothetical protein
MRMGSGKVFSFHHNCSIHAKIWAPPRWLFSQTLTIHPWPIQWVVFTHCPVNMRLYHELFTTFRWYSQYLGTVGGRCRRTACVISFGFGVSPWWLGPLAQSRFIMARNLPSHKAFSGFDLDLRRGATWAMSKQLELWLSTPELALSQREPAWLCLM